MQILFNQIRLRKSVLKFRETIHCRHSTESVGSLNSDVRDYHRYLCVGLILLFGTTSHGQNFVVRNSGCSAQDSTKIGLSAHSPGIA